MLSSPFYGVFSLAQFSQDPFVSFEFGHQGRRQGHPVLQHVQHELADRIDLVGVGVLKHVFSLETITLLQDGLEEIFVSLYPLHRARVV